VSKWVRCSEVVSEQTLPAYLNPDNGFRIRVVASGTVANKWVLEVLDASDNVLTWLVGLYDSVARADEVLRLTFGAIALPIE